MITFNIDFVVGIDGIALLSIDEVDVASSLKTNVVLDDIQHLGITYWIAKLPILDSPLTSIGMYTMYGKLQVNYNDVEFTYYDIVICKTDKGNSNDNRI